jgi:IS1 family transposase
MDAFSNSDKTIDVPTRKQQPMITHNIDNQVLVGEDIKKKWDEAKNGKETAAALIAVNEMVLHDLNQVINRATGDLTHLAERYSRLSLAGSCSDQMRSAVRFLEQQHMAMKRNRTAQEKVENVKESLRHMKRKLELLNKVERYRKECRDRKQGVK